MEHLVKRNSNFLTDPMKKKIVEVGKKGRYTQSRIGSPYFALDGSQKPIKLTEGDIIWMMDTGYGVYAKSKIVRIHKTEKIKTLKHLEELRTSFDIEFSIQDNFWDYEKSKLMKAMQQKKYLYFTVIDYEIVEADFDHFPVETPNGLARSWIFLDEYKKEKMFAWRGKKSIEQYIIESNSDDYFKINNDVKYKVTNIWQNKRTDGQPIIKGVDFDHFVPKHAGGPGIFPENVVPLERGLNRYKSNRIPKQFAIVAKKYGFKEITTEILDNWDATIKSKKNRKYVKQLEIAKGINNKIRKWHVKRQRKFFLGVLKETYPGIEQRYKKAGIPIP